MKKKLDPKQEIIQLQKNIRSEQDQWNVLRDHGGHDPFWADGVNMNLTRNHIIYAVRTVKQICDNNGFEVPEWIHGVLIPPEVDENYMARKEEIRANAKKMYAKILKDPNYNYLQKAMPRLSSDLLKRFSVSAVMGYAENLKNALVSDDYITMRRYEWTWYLDSFKQCAEKIKAARKIHKAGEQLTFADIMAG